MGGSSVVLLLLISLVIPTSGVTDNSCPDGEPPVYCYVNPCDVAKCPNDPGAKCKANYCGECNAVFYNSIFNEDVITNCKVLAKRDASISTDEAALQSLLDQIDADRIGEFIKAMTEWPRNTQSDWMGEKEDTVRQMFKNFGMEVITKKYKVLHCFPQEVNSSLTEVLDQDGIVLDTYREDGDKTKKILPAFNAWSKSGTVEGEPVYVNYGRKQDFDHLKTLDMDLTGKIGIARYGKLHRGDKAKFAKENGLAGLIIYTDAADYNPSPKDFPPMPDGPGLPKTGVQRGSLKMGLGDPSTYLYPSTKYAYHDSKEDYDAILPGIVVMPINFKNALPLLKDLDGDEVILSDDSDENWQGAGSEDVPTYRYGPGFKSLSKSKLLRITVNLDFKKVDIENIFGVIKGRQEPDRWVMIGNHRDTWVHGAVDATTGLSVLNEIGYGLSVLLNKSWRPRRTIVLASWGAEEQGKIGSTEFVEDYITLLQDKMVAYINVDVAASGQHNFEPAATPNFRPLLERATRKADGPLDGHSSLYRQWKAISAQNGDAEPKLKTLSSSSDYAAFYNIAGVSCIDLTIVGPYYTYHTEYDNYEYLSKYADPGMRATKVVTQVATVILFELAVENVVPLDAVSYSNFVLNTITGSELEADLKGQDIAYSMLEKALDKFVKTAEEYEASKQRYKDKSSKHVELRRFNDKMLQMERSFIAPQGLPNRPQNRNILFAPSIMNSYSGSVFPGLFDAIAAAKLENGKEKDWNEVRKQLTIATWVTRAAARSLSSTVFPH